MQTGCDVTLIYVYIYVQLYCSSVLYVPLAILSLPKDSHIIEQLGARQSCYKLATLQGFEVASNV